MLKSSLSDALPRDATAPIDVSVILTTYNRAAGLSMALDGLSRQQVKNSLFTYEIIVVDDGSCDETPAILGRAQQRDPSLRVIHISNSGVSKARDTGVNNSRGTWIAFCDDDQIPSPQWLSALYRVATASRAACVGGPVSLMLPPSCEMSLGARARRLLGEDDFGTDVRPYPSGAAPGTGNVMIEREVFSRVGGFDIAFAQGGEDAEFFRRVRNAGLSILYAPDAHMQHVIPPSRLRVEFFEWVARRIGVSDARIYHKHEAPWRIGWRIWLRLAILGVRDLPVLALAPSRSTRRLDAMCSMQYTMAFVRGSASFAMPGVFANNSYFQRLNFRDHGGERDR